MRNADLGRFTLDRLIKMLGALDDSIEISIQLAPRRNKQEANETGGKRLEPA